MPFDKPTISSSSETRARAAIEPDISPSMASMSAGAKALKAPDGELGSALPSREPRRVSAYLMSRYDRNQLYEDVWAASLKKVAKRLGICDSALGHICKRLAIPLPGVGYWNKRDAGKPVKERPPLPEVELIFSGTLTARPLAGASPVVVSGRLSERFNREELFEDVWLRPMTQLTAKWGISDSALGLVCRRLHIPLPGVGYWNKKGAGKYVPPRPPLPAVKIDARYLTRKRLATPPQAIEQSSKRGSEIAESILLSMESSSEATLSVIRPVKPDTTDPDAIRLGKLDFPVTVDQVERSSAFPVVQQAVRSAMRSDRPKQIGHVNRHMTGRQESNAVRLEAHQHGQINILHRDELMASSAAGQANTGVESPNCSSESGQPTVSAFLVSKYKREQLYEDIWKYPLRDVAKKLGVSDVALGKNCRKLHIPIPPRGYWNKVAAGKPVEGRPALPSVELI